MAHAGFLSHRESKKRYRHKNKKSGICVDCSKKAKEDRVRCQFHLDINNESSKKSKLKLLQNTPSRRK